LGFHQKRNPGCGKEKLEAAPSPGEEPLGKTFPPEKEKIGPIGEFSKGRGVWEPAIHVCGRKRGGGKKPIKGNKHCLGGGRERRGTTQRTIMVFDIGRFITGQWGRKRCNAKLLSCHLLWDRRTLKMKKKGGGGVYPCERSLRQCGAAMRTHRANFWKNTLKKWGSLFAPTCLQTDSQRGPEKERKPSPCQSPLPYPDKKLVKGGREK